jgi:hypothetical protein
MLMTGPISWHQLYCSEVDSLLENSLIEWAVKDKRGMYYSLLKISDSGKIEYMSDSNANTTKDT